MKSVLMLLMLPLADQGENLQNFTSFCRTIIEVENISGKVQFKAWKSQHLIWTPLFLAHPIVNRSATRPPASPDRTCAAAHCWDDDYDVLLAIRHLLAATAPHPQADQQPTEPQEPDHPMPPGSISPASTADQNAEHQREEPEPDHAATPPAPTAQKKIYATLASTLAPMDAEQYYQSIQRDLRADHATLQGWKQEKRNDKEWGTEEDLLWEDTWKGTTEAFLESAAETYPRPPGDTRHGLHARLAFHSWKHRHSITLHPLHHNPHRWTPEDDASAAITVQQSPANPEEYHITWNDPAPQPTASSTLPDVLATISAELQEAKAPQQTTKRCPRHHPHQPHKKAPAQSPSPTPSPQ